MLVLINLGFDDLRTKNRCHQRQGVILKPHHLNKVWVGGPPTCTTSLGGMCSQHERTVILCHPSPPFEVMSIHI